MSSTPRLARRASRSAFEVGRTKARTALPASRSWRQISPPKPIGPVAPTTRSIYPSSRKHSALPSGAKMLPLLEAKPGGRDAVRSSGGTPRSRSITLRGQRGTVHGAVVASIKVGGRTRVGAAGDVFTNEQPREQSTGGRQRGANQHGRAESTGERGWVQICSSSQSRHAGNHRDRE